MANKNYAFGVHATVEVEGKVFRVWNEVTGLIEKEYDNYKAAADHARMLKYKYATVLRGY